MSENTNYFQKGFVSKLKGEPMDVDWMDRQYAQDTDEIHTGAGRVSQYQSGRAFAAYCIGCGSNTAGFFTDSRMNKEILALYNEYYTIQITQVGSGLA